jgi:hypothetical protein
MNRDFDDLVDVDGLDPAEEERLRRVHDLLVQAGPPPDLPPALARPPTRRVEGEILQFPLLPGRRVAAAIVVAAALAAAAFGGGYLVASHKHQGGTFEAVRIVPMRGAHGAVGTIRVGKRDSVGNWPMEVVVAGLPTQEEGAYYELYLSERGRPTIPCGGFRVNGKVTTVRLSVPYELTSTTQWVLAVWPKHGREHGRVVMSTV